MLQYNADAAFDNPFYLRAAEGLSTAFDSPARTEIFEAVGQSVAALEASNETAFGNLRQRALTATSRVHLIVVALGGTVLWLYSHPPAATLTFWTIVASVVLTSLAAMIAVVTALSADRLVGIHRVSLERLMPFVDDPRTAGSRDAYLYWILPTRYAAAALTQVSLDRAADRVHLAQVAANVTIGMFLVLLASIAAGWGP